MKKILTLSFLVIGLLIFVSIPFADAKGFVHLRSINYPLENDYLITSSNNEVDLKILSNSTRERLTLKMMTIASREKIKNFFTLPENREPASDLYFVKFTPVSVDNFTVQPEMTISYEPDDRYKEVYFYDWTQLKFVKLESDRDELNKTITVQLPKRKKIMIALFNESELIGKASWYVHPKYEGQLIAASRDFVVDSKLRVINLYNNKETIVTIKDYGPKKCEDWTEREQELMGPCQERILDLSKEAFLQLATTTGVGVISNVKVVPLDL